MEGWLSSLLNVQVLRPAFKVVMCYKSLSLFLLIFILFCYEQHAFIQELGEASLLLVDLDLVLVIFNNVLLRKLNRPILEDLTISSDAFQAS